MLLIHSLLQQIPVAIPPKLNFPKSVTCCDWAQTLQPAVLQIPICSLAYSLQQSSKAVWNEGKVKKVCHTLPALQVWDMILKVNVSDCTSAVFRSRDDGTTRLHSPFNFFFPNFNPNRDIPELNLVQLHGTSAKEGGEEKRRWITMWCSRLAASHVVKQISSWVCKLRCITKGCLTLDLLTWNDEGAGGEEHSYYICPVWKGEVHTQGLYLRCTGTVWLHRARLASGRRRKQRETLVSCAQNVLAHALVCLLVTVPV